MGLITNRIIRVALSSAAWRTASQEWRAGFLAGIRAATTADGLPIQLLSADGARLDEVGS